MNKIKQNKINFTLILTTLAIIFSSLTVLSLPVLFNYESKVTKIENNFYKNFKIFINTSGKITYKPFPKPHLLVENASLDLSQLSENKQLINTSNLKIYISLRDIYLRSFRNLISTEISNTNLEFNISDIKDIRKHLYKKINKPIYLINCRIFIKNKNNEVTLISPIKKIAYSINNKKKIKNLNIDGAIFGLSFKSEWKRDYNIPQSSFHKVNIFNPNIELKNIFKFKNGNNFIGTTQISYAQDKLEYEIQFNKNKINILSPKDKNINFNLNSEIQLKPFYFDGRLLIKNRKVEKIIDNLLSNLLSNDKNYLGNFNGKLKISFKELKNKLIKSGTMNFSINEKQIYLNKAEFELDKIGNITSDISFVENDGQIKFVSSNQLNIKNHIEFAKIFQVSTKKVKKIERIFFDLEKDIGETDFTINNIKINNMENKINLNEEFIIKNIQNLRSNIRNVID